MANIVVISGQFGDGHTSFSGSPVIIRVSGLAWPVSSPFTIVRVEVKYGDVVVGDFRADAGGQSEITFDISSALRAIWADYDFSAEVSAAESADLHSRAYRAYTIALYTEYLSSDGVFITTQSGTLDGGTCSIGWLTEWERSEISSGDMSVIEHSNPRNGDASTKPGSVPERVGLNSITSWVDVSSYGTVSHFYAAPDKSADPDSPTPAYSTESYDDHAPTVLRDSVPYVDFLFVNRRGAVETCSALTKESMSIDVESQQFSLVERPSFAPSQSLMALAKGGRRSWQMSSGYLEREWCEWWVMEFLMAKRWWMRFPIGSANGKFVPVVVTPAKKTTTIFDRAKQNMGSVEFTVTMALEG